MINISNIQIPEGCTHWCETSFKKNSPNYHFYNGGGPNNEEIQIYKNGRWIRWNEWCKMLWDSKRVRPTIPNFNWHGWNRCEETANDKIQQIKERFENEQFS